MKKTYKAPQMDIVELFAGPMMTITSPNTSDDPNPNGGRGYAIDQATSEARGDWSGIWDNM